jgi:hypothetical protein
MKPSPKSWVGKNICTFNKKRITMKWAHYTKEVNGPSAEIYFPITENLEYLLDESKEKEHEENMKAHCSDWAENVNQDGMHRGFNYRWEVVDMPPKGWVNREMRKAERELAALEEKKNLLISLYGGWTLLHESEVVNKKGMEVFEEESRFKNWLWTANRALNGRAPVDTPAEIVIDILNRIEEGVHS